MHDESARMDRFPGIAFRGPEHDRRAWLRGTAFDVWGLISGYRDFESIEHVVKESQITEQKMRLALDYYAAYPEEIDSAIAANEITPEQVAILYPHLNIKH